MPYQKRAPKKAPMFSPEEQADMAVVLAELKLRKMYEPGMDMQMAVALGEFTTNFRKDNGIRAMVDFIGWCKGNGQKDIIGPTLGHDLNGRNDAFMLPRTHGYLGKGAEVIERAHQPSGSG